MAEKLKLDLSLILLDIPDERDACVGRLTELLQAEGLEKVHVTRDNSSTRLCLHYDPQQFNVSRVRELAQVAGAKLGKQFHHASLRIDGMDCSPGHGDRACLAMHRRHSGASVSSVAERKVEGHVAFGASRSNAMLGRMLQPDDPVPVRDVHVDSLKFARKKHPIVGNEVSGFFQCVHALL